MLTPEQVKHLSDTLDKMATLAANNRHPVDLKWLFKTYEDLHSFAKGDTDNVDA